MRCDVLDNIRWFAMSRACRLIVALCSLPLLAANAHAATHVEVVETFPAGDRVALYGGENFYLRLHYETDAPVHIWARPYFRGEPVQAGSNPSSSYTGDGEALGWFFLQTQDGAVDEVRITVGDGTSRGTTLALSYPVQVFAGHGNRVDRDSPPEWVTSLIAAAEQQRRAEQERADRSSSGSSGLWLASFMIVVLALLAASVWFPIRAVRRWRGGWRLSAVVPLALIGFVVLRIVVGVSVNPTAHNLWPFEILQAGFLSVGVMVVLTVLRKLTGAADAT